MDERSVSVIINTYNRAHHLKRLLDCLARQSYENFEVVVVNGPSTDGTDEVLKAYRRAIRFEKCPEVNLCMSRNIGIKVAAGEIIAFIDDDAVPENIHWIKNAVKCFSDPEIGAVGGAVYRLGHKAEFENGYGSIWGDNITVAECPPEEDELDSYHFRRVPGGNAFYLKKALLETGGFDEYYVYFLDESDLCFRLKKAGYKIEYGKNMAIIHEAAKGANREKTYRLNWPVISRSMAYFVMKSSEGLRFSTEERKQKAREACKIWKENFEDYLSARLITEEEYKEYNEEIIKGCESGIQAGLKSSRKLIENYEPKSSQYKKFDKSVSHNHLNICLFCEDDILTPIGGVPVYTKQLAFGLASRGHNVYVITKGEKELLSNVDGVNLCYVVSDHIPLDATEKLPNGRVRMDFSYACYHKLEEIKPCFQIDVVESPIWDSYGLVTSYLEQELPMAVRLQTPLKEVIENFNFTFTPDLKLLTEYETAMLLHADHIITISDCIKETIESLYELHFPQKVSKNYLGIKPEVKAVSSRKENDGKLVVFFVGRLERRKGIDSILAAVPKLLEKYPNLEFRLAGNNEIFDEVIGDTYKHKFIKENAKEKWIRRVRFLGKISDEQKEQEYADCDVFISPSLYESFGIIFIEAMRYAKPVIGCRAGGMQEVISDGETGLLCEPGNAEDFARCLDQLLSDRDLRERLGKAGRERMHKMFSESVMSQRCEEIYLEMIQEKNFQLSGKGKTAD